VSPIPPRNAGQSAGARPILVIRGGAIGDFVLTLPVLAALRRRFPASPLAVLGRPHIVPLAMASGLADEVRSIESRALAAFFVRDAPLDPEWTAFLAGFGSILSFLHDPDGTFRENLARCSHSQFIAGPPRPDESQGRHATEVFLEPLERLGIVRADPVPRLSLSRPRGDRSAAGPPRSLPPMLAAHPGSGSPRKNWPEAQWAALLGRLIRQTDFQLLLIGGEAEGDRVGRLAAALPVSRVHAARDLPLVELAERLTGCAAFIGHDSGISHLAAALGLPGVALWGDSVEDVWRPRSPRILLLRHPPGLADLSVDQVMDALLAVWARQRQETPPASAGLQP
jgi:heptosyltransferase-3